MARDSWVKVNLGTVFPGMGKSLSTISASLNTIKLDADAVIQNVGQRAYAASEAIEVTANLLDALNQTGYNQLFMIPSNIPFNERIATANNKPVDDEWTAGLVILIQAPSLSETAEKYKALLDIITAPMPDV